MKNSHKGFILPLVIIIIAALAIGGGAYVYTKNNQNNNSQTSGSNSDSQNQTSNKSDSNESANKNTQTVPDNQKPITVLSPNGGEIFKTGDALDIHWKSNIKGPHKINIILQGIDETRTIQVVSNLQENVSSETGTSKYTWIIPANLWGQFIVRVSSFDSNGEDNIDNTIADHSDAPFIINVPNPSATAGWKTYTNQEFSIKYPLSLSVAPGKEIGTAYNQPDVAQYVNLKSTGGTYSTENLYVFSAESSSAISSCLKAPNSTETDVSKINTITINGVQFLSFEAYSPAAGLFNEWHEYHTMHNGRCYIISAQIAGKQPSHIDNAFQKQVAETEISGMESILDTAAKTFTFAN